MLSEKRASTKTMIDFIRRPVWSASILHYLRARGEPCSVSKDGGVSRANYLPPRAVLFNAASPRPTDDHDRPTKLLPSPFVDSAAVATRLERCWCPFLVAAPYRRLKILYGCVVVVVFDACPVIPTVSSFFASNDDPTRHHHHHGCHPNSRTATAAAT